MNQLNSTNNTNYWLVVYSMNTGDFKNATISSNPNEDTDTLSAQFESIFPDYRVIHIGEGEQPPKTYRSLEYVN